MGGQNNSLFTQSYYLYVFKGKGSTSMFVSYRKGRLQAKENSLFFSYTLPMHKRQDLRYVQQQHNFAVNTGRNSSWQQFAIQRRIYGRHNKYRTEFVFVSFLLKDGVYNDVLASYFWLTVKVRIKTKFNRMQCGLNGWLRLKRTVQRSVSDNASLKSSTHISSF